MYNQQYIVVKDDYNSAGKISSQIKQTLKQIGFDPQLIRKMAVACYEAEINMIIHSYGGKIILEIDNNKVNMYFEDVGPGIKNIDNAMKPGYSTANEKAREFGFGAGMGLPNIKRVSDDFELKTSDKGTELKIGFNIA